MLLLKTIKQEWFDEWFDSPYYPILYQNRNEKEAHFFINNLYNLLKISPNHKILDVACGRGRHSIFLHSKGAEVVGIDLSEMSILEAQKNQKKDLRFYVQDMREPFMEKDFDIVCNLFTSFGYFETQKENLKVLQNIYNALKENGLLIIDFLNPTYTIKNLVQYETKTLNNITFEIEKIYHNNIIEKNIRFQDNHQYFHFIEKVRLFEKEDFLDFFQKIGFELLYIFGDYALNEYEKNTSERMILIAKKYNLS
jgi:SAM-dependent methyltransferase